MGASFERMLAARAASEWVSTAGLRIPILGLGTAVFGEGNTDGTLERVAAQAAHQGIRLFDTAQIQSSLSALGTDYIDSALIHWPVCLDDPEADHQAVRRGCWKALEQLVMEKKVRHIGVSNYTCELLDELQGYATISPCVNQIEFSPIVYQQEV